MLRDVADCPRRGRRAFLAAHNGELVAGVRRHVHDFMHEAGCRVGHIDRELLAGTGHRECRAGCDRQRGRT